MPPQVRMRRVPVFSGRRRQASRLAGCSCCPWAPPSAAGQAGKCKFGAKGFGSRVSQGADARSPGWRVASSALERPA